VELLPGDLLLEDEDELGVLLLEELGRLLLDEELDGALVEPALELPLMPDEVLPEEPELDLLKYASHSERETWPSLFLSTSEKLGVEADASWLLLEVPPADEDGVDELVPEDEDEDGLVAEGLDEDDEDCATASDDRAKRTAAVMMLRLLGMEPPEVSGKKNLRSPTVQSLCR